MFTPEEFRELNQRYEALRNPNITWNKFLPIAGKIIVILLPILSLLIWSETSYPNTPDLENPTVYLCSAYLIALAIWGIPKIRKWEKENRERGPNCPYCKSRINIHKIKLVMISDRCPDCGRVIVSPSLKETPEPGGGING